MNFSSRKPTNLKQQYIANYLIPNVKNGISFALRHPKKTLIFTPIYPKLKTKPTIVFGYPLTNKQINGLDTDVMFVESSRDN